MDKAKDVVKHIGNIYDKYYQSFTTGERSFYGAYSFAALYFLCPLKSLLLRHLAL